MLVPIVPLLAAWIGLALLAGCDTVVGNQTPLPPPGFKPVVTFVSPANGSSAAVNDRVPLDAIAEDASGILRVDLLVNGTVTDSQPLFVATRRFEYQTTWRPLSAGETRLTIVAYNVNNVASDPVTVRVNVSGPAVTATTVPGTPTLTPFVLYVTSTPPPTRQIITPAVTVITATPPPTQTRAPAANPARTVAVTATITQTRAITITPVSPTQTRTP